MKRFENLTEQEQELLLTFPAYVSLLAANIDGKLDQKEERAAIEFNHIKTYSCDPALAEFYQEVDKNFKDTIDNLNKALPLGKENRDTAIKNKLAELDSIVKKLDPDFASVIHRSMQSFKDHVSNAHHNVLIDFIFPIPIKGLSY